MDLPSLRRGVPWVKSLSSPHAPERQKTLPFDHRIASTPYLRERGHPVRALFVITRSGKATWRYEITAHLGNRPANNPDRANGRRAIGLFARRPRSTL